MLGLSVVYIYIYFYNVNSVAGKFDTLGGL